MPKLVALGEGDDTEFDDDTDDNIVSNLTRLVVLSKLLSVAEKKSFSSALPIARDLIHMEDYMETEGVLSPDWNALVDEKYAGHFQRKAEFLSIADNIMPALFNGKITETAHRNKKIREWINYDFKGRVIVCGSTASIPATRDLMIHIAGLPNGFIILPGKIYGQKIEDNDFCNPYFMENQFLKKLGLTALDAFPLGVKDNDIDFFNAAFNNFGGKMFAPNSVRRIDTMREGEEMDVAAEIAKDAQNQNKSVLIITPDSAGNQRLRESLERRGVSADFSAGVPAVQSKTARHILNLLADAQNNLQIKNLIEWLDSVNIDFSESDAPIILKLQELSNALCDNDITLGQSDMASVIRDVLSNVQMRGTADDAPSVRVLGMIESRMQSADVIILTGLNEGMFPSHGYENPWLPRHISQKIGLPPPQRKVSLMALDFMTLSCGDKVYWLRSRASGGAQTTQSRFLSRVDVRAHNIKYDNHFLDIVRAQNNLPYKQLSSAAPTPPADWSPVFVTALELLIHNPYAFYAKHILHLSPKKEWWAGADARDFGDVVHKEVENLIKNNITPNEVDIIKSLEKRATDVLPANSVMMHFWKKRFIQIAPKIVELLTDPKIKNIQSEVLLKTQIHGRLVCAIADMAFDTPSGPVALDIKTGSVPSKKDLIDGMMPQLPAEAIMIGAVAIKFLQLKNNDVKPIEYTGDDLENMINGTKQKLAELFNMYGQDFAPYEYRLTGNIKYDRYRDLGRIDD
ncbi:MAG: PD-(D/E)XK nuclease family protein [Rickettsiales bacterium]|nr:PD-(D/E)XK nuclease family protein [Rickettsiales bacterium]